MFLQMNEKKSLMLMQIIITVTAVALPVFIGALPSYTELYLMFTAYSLAFIGRIKNTEKIEVSALSFILLALLCYAGISSLWIDNREGHLLYIAGLATVLIFISLLTDSFCAGNKESTRRRFMYLLTFGGAFCAGANIIYWLLKIVPYAKNEKMSLGFANSDFLAVFMFSCLAISCALLKNNGKIRKRIICLFMLLMGLVFVMTASLLIWLMALAFVGLCYLKKRSDKFFFTGSIVMTGLFFVLTAVFALSGSSSNIFSEVFCYGIKSFFGRGGGYLSSKELFLGANIEHGTTGIIAYLTACSGVAGLMAAILIIAIGFINFIKLKNYSSLFSLFLTALIMFLPFEGICTLIFYSGVTVYNLYLSGATVNKTIKKHSEVRVKRIITALIILCLISVILLTGTFVRSFADSLYRKKNYAQAYEYYKAAASINLSDAKSCVGAVKSLRKGKIIAENKEEAINLINSAIKREPGNLEHIKEKALIYKVCGEFEKAAQQYRYAIRTAINGDEYRLLLADILYSAIKLYPKGSVNSREIYNEIVVIAQETADLDYKKQINDIADKALVYKKGEINDAG